MAAPLHVPSLAIEGFRGVSSLELPRLGRITLLAGRNGVGKTTVLEAVRMYASRGHMGALFEILDTREEYRPGDDEIVHVDFSSLFHDGGRAQKPKPIRIGPGSEDLILGLVDPEPDDDSQGSAFDGSKVLSVQIGKHHIKVPGISYVEYQQWKRPTRLGREAIPRSDAWPPAIQIETLGPGLLENSDLAGFWDTVALTDGEELAVEALRIVLGDDVERLTVVGDGKPHLVGISSRGRRALVKLRSSRDPVPLKRLGDGANRLLGIALALANCRDGILLIDEAENGIHYSVQADMWRMVFRAAERANVQVIAATHSWDCVTGFAAAAIESESDGVLYRLEEVDGELYAVHYPEDELEVAARQRIEVR